MELLGRFDLRNRETGAFDAAELYSNVGEADIPDVMQVWKPMLEARRRQFPSAETAAVGNVGDWHWDWAAIAREIAASMAHELFAVTCGGHTQGLMATAAPRFARLEVQRGRELVYVEFISTAPWNRRLFTPLPRYKGVGRLLMATAISYSIELGFNGRIGLHSLPGSLGWYRHSFPFTDLGHDAAKSMHYFEMTEADAAAVISDAQRSN